MACLVALERLNPVERAVFMLHDVFEFPHDEIATIVDSSAEASRKSLERAREKLAAKKRMFRASREEHQRLLFAFLAAVGSGDVSQIVSVLARDAVLFADAGAGGRTVGNIRNLPAPLHGAEKIAAFVLAASQVTELRPEMRELNGQPAVVFERRGEPFAALLLGVADGTIFEVYFHADLSRLRHTGSVRTGAVASIESLRPG
jgi:RNA polymerase sigma-70 factor (ECF subfamily)